MQGEGDSPRCPSDLQAGKTRDHRRHQPGVAGSLRNGTPARACVGRLKRASYEVREMTFTATIESASEALRRTVASDVCDRATAIGARWRRRATRARVAAATPSGWSTSSSTPSTLRTTPSDAHTLTALTGSAATSELLTSPSVRSELTRGARALPRAPAARRALGPLPARSGARPQRTAPRRTRRTPAVRARGGP